METTILNLKKKKRGFLHLHEVVFQAISKTFILHYAVFCKAVM